MALCSSRLYVGFFVTAVGFAFAACGGGEIESLLAPATTGAAGSGGTGGAGRGGAGAAGASGAAAGTGGMGGKGVGGAAGRNGAGGASGNGGASTGGTGGVGGAAGSGGATGGNGGASGAGGMANGPSLGAASTFAVLAGTTVTNTGASIITGDLGVSSPGMSATGFPPGTVVMGSIQVGTSTANQAQADAILAYGALAGAPCGTPLMNMELGGQALTPGVYCLSSEAHLAAQLTLDANNDPNATFVFQIATTLITATGGSVVLLNGAKASNVFWQVGTGATLGGGTAFTGVILAQTSITMVSGASLVGRALAQAAVTLDTNVVTVSPP